MIKLSKKQLVELANSLGAYKFTGNVYTYETIVTCLSGYEVAEYTLKASSDSKYLELIHNYNSIIYYKEVNKLAYSCGLYGNTGQLHEFKIYERATNKLLDVYYTYY